MKIIFHVFIPLSFLYSANDFKRKMRSGIQICFTKKWHSKNVYKHKYGICVMGGIWREREHTAHVWICLVYVSMITLFCNGTSVLHQALTKFQIETFRVHGTFLFHFVIKHEIRMNKTNYMHEKKKNNLFTILCTKAKKKKTMNFRYYIMMVLLLLLLSLLILLYDVKCDDMKCV